MRRFPDRGFTLLETLVSLVILAFSLAGLSMLMVGNVQTGFVWSDQIGSHQVQLQSLLAEWLPTSRERDVRWSA